jgi:hypothetical protein
MLLLSHVRLYNMDYNENSLVCKNWKEGLLRIYILSITDII